MESGQERLKEILAEAVARTDPSARAAYLAEACAGDTALRSKVEGLIAAYEKRGDFVEKTLTVPGLVQEGPGTMIGRYKLLQEIGEGAFGVVYMAEQTEPVERKVALKIIKAGMDTRAVIARFEAERQALALMDHPNIAKIFDAGTTDAPSSQPSTLNSQLSLGRPYFVMELVKGLPITHYADKHNLLTEERLRLFMQVCHGVQHAHQKAIIHRDLKPTNILVTLIDGQPVPKIIDFGVAKALGHKLTDKTLFTAFEQIIGTPAYMSPEQAELSGVDIDTRSDIYALGVLLYELLTGVTPFDQETLRQAALDEVRRIIRETEPPKPSTRLQALVAADVRRRKSSSDRQPTEEEIRASSRRLLQIKETIRLVHGDLDWIVMKALEKDRRRRYETAGALAEDLQRHRDHEPVQAGPPGAAYRARKFIRRHRFGVAMATSVALALAAGLTAALMGFGEASRERDRAEHERDRAEHQAQIAQNERATADRERYHAERTLLRMELQRAEDAFAADNVSVGLACLAWVLRKDPTNQGAAERILSALTYRNFPLPLFGPLQHSGPVHTALFSARGGRIVTASSDGTARVWDARTGQALLQPLAHEAEVRYAEFSPDELRVLTVSSNLCRLWDTSTGRALGTNITHQDVVCTAHFSPDGNKVVTASADGTARISDAQTGQMLAGPLQHKGCVSSAEFSPDGQAVLTTSWDKTARVWDARTGQPLTEPLVHEASVRFGCFSPDGKCVLTAAHQSPCLWDAAAGLPAGRPFTHERGLPRVCYAQSSPGGRRVVTTSDSGYTARIWDVVARRILVSALSHHCPLTDAQFSPNGWIVVTASSDGMARLWGSTTGRLAALAIQHQLPIVSARFSPDSQCVLTASADGTTGVWDARCGAAAAVCLHAVSLQDVTAGFCEFSPDGQRVVTTRVYDARTGVPVCGRLIYKAGLHSARFSPDGRYVATASWDRTARVWDALTGKPVTALLEHESSVRSARFSPDGERVVTATVGPDNSAWIWSVKGGGQLLQRLKDNQGVLTASFHPDNRRVLTASVFGTAVVWDGDTGQTLVKLLRHAGSVGSAEFSPDGGRIVTASSDGTARVWDTDTGKPVTKPLKHNGDVVSAEFSPDGLLVATASSDKTARVWDARSGEPLTDPLQHDGWVQTVQFSPDSRRVVTCTGEGTARVWDAYTGLPRSEVLKHGTRRTRARFSPDGQRVLTTSGDLPARIWDAPSAPLPIPQWLPLLAEAVNRQRYSDNGALEFVPATNILDLKRSILGRAENDSYTRWARWFFADRTTRTISPFSSVAVTNSVRWLLEQMECPETDALREVDLENPTADTLNNLAWRLATDADSKARDGQTAVVLAEAAVRSTGRTNAMYLDTLAAAYAEARQFTNAVTAQKEAIALLTTEEEKKDYASRLKLYAAGIPYHDDASLAQAVSALLDEGKFAEAELAGRECLALCEKQIPDNWLAFDARSLLGGSLLGQKKYAEAEPLLLSGYEGMMQREAGISAEGRRLRLTEALQRLVQLYEATDRPTQAAEWKQKLAEFEKGEALRTQSAPPK